MLRRSLVVLGVLCLCGAVLPFVIETVERLRGNHYPGTAQRAEAVYLLVSGKQLALALQFYADEHGWPDHLSQIVGSDGVTEKMLQYPILDDLPDRRDLADWKDFAEWIYVKPRDDAPQLPLLIAPVPYSSSMGRRLPMPKRIIVRRDTVAEAVDEVTIRPVLETLRGR